MSPRAQNEICNDLRRHEVPRTALPQSAEYFFATSYADAEGGEDCVAPKRRMKFAMTYAGTKCRGPHCLKAQNIYLRHLTQTPKAARTVSQKIYSSTYPLSSINVWTLFSISAMTSSRVFWPEKYAGISSLTMTMIAGSREATWEQVAIISSYS